MSTGNITHATRAEAIRLAGHCQVLERSYRHASEDATADSERRTEAARMADRWHRLGEFLNHAGATGFDIVRHVPSETP